MIYAVHVLDEKFIKIGFTKSTDVNKRIAELQTGNPFEIKPLFITEGSLIQEQSIHKALLDGFTRIRIPHPPNEWYPGRNTFFQEFIRILESDGVIQSYVFLDSYNQNVKQPGKSFTSVFSNMKWPSLNDRKTYIA